MAPELYTRFEIRCPEPQHLLGQMRVPNAHLAPGKPAIYASVYCSRCRAWVECTFTDAAPEARESDDRWQADTWRRQRRLGFQVRSPDGRHLLGRVSIPTAFLKPGEPAIAFYTVVKATGQKTETVFGGMQAATNGPPGDTVPGKAVACGGTS